MSSQIAFCQSPVQRKSISIPVLSRSVREPWQSLHWWEKGFNTDLLLRFSIFMLLEAFKLCIIGTLGSLIKAYTMQANLEFWVHLLQVDIKMCCVDQFSGDINSRDGINVLYMIKTLKPHLATQEAAQEASKALFLFIYFFLPSPGTTSGKAMRNPTLRGSVSIKPQQAWRLHRRLVLTIVPPLCFRACFCFVLFLSSCTYWERNENIVDGVGSYPAGKNKEVDDSSFSHCQVK